MLICKSVGGLSTPASHHMECQQNWYLPAGGSHEPDGVRGRQRLHYAVTVVTYVVLLIRLVVWRKNSYV